MSTPSTHRKGTGLTLGGYARAGYLGGHAQAARLEEEQLRRRRTEQNLLDSNAERGRVSPSEEDGLPPLQATVTPRATHNRAGEYFEMPSTRTTATTIQVSKEEHDGPRDAKNTLTRENRDLKSDNKKLANELKGKEAELKGKEAELKAMSEERARLKRNFDSLMSKFQNKRKKAKTTKYEQADDIVGFIRAHVKDELFRNVKFTTSKKQLAKVTKKVWDAIKGKHKLDQAPINLSWEEFNRIYAATVASEVSDRRQYCQTRGQAAAQGELIWTYLRLILATANPKSALLCPHYLSLL